MLNRLTHSNKQSQIILATGLCLATVLAIGSDCLATKATEQNLTSNGLMQNGTSLNGTSFNGMSFNGLRINGANLNGTGMSENGVHSNKFGLTPPTLGTATLNQKPISKIHLKGGQLALKI